jgi:hypothetical protein
MRSSSEITCPARALNWGNVASTPTIGDAYGCMPPSAWQPEQLILALTWSRAYNCVSLNSRSPSRMLSPLVPLGIDAIDGGVQAGFRSSAVASPNEGISLHRDSSRTCRPNTTMPPYTSDTSAMTARTLLRMRALYPIV